MILYARLEPPIDGPVGGVDCRPANAIPVLLQERTHAIALLQRVAFLEERITKERDKIRIASNQRFILEGVSLKLRKGDLVISCARIEIEV